MQLRCQLALMTMVVLAAGLTGCQQVQPSKNPYYLDEDTIYFPSGPEFEQSRPVTTVAESAKNNVAAP